VDEDVRKWVNQRKKYHFITPK